jgi:DNA repair protein RadC
VHAASLVDLVAIALSRRPEDVDECEKLARKLLMDSGNFRSLAQGAASELQEAAGFEEFEVTRLLATIEIGRRAALSGKGPIQSIEGPEDVASLLERFRNDKQERFIAILLDTKHNILREVTIHVGTASMSIVSPRDVFRAAVREGAAAVIVAHNHPSGDPTPSVEDIEVTDRLIECGRLLDVPVLDHVILGDGHTPERAYVSLRQRGVQFEQ